MQHTHKKRLVSIDTLKGFSVLFMIFIHIPMYLILIEEKTSFSYFILNTFAKISAPIFLFFVGFNLFLSIHNNKTPKKNIAKKSLYFFAIGLIFSLIWTPDIIHFIGFFMLFNFVL